MADADPRRTVQLRQASDDTSPEGAVYLDTRSEERKARNRAILQQIVDEDREVLDALDACRHCGAPWGVACDEAEEQGHPARGPDASGPVPVTDPRWQHCPECAGGRVDCPVCDGEGIVEVAARGGAVPRYTPSPDSVLVILSPGRQITDPDEAEALGLTADARRMRKARRG